MLRSVHGEGGQVESAVGRSVEGIDTEAVYTQRQGKMTSPWHLKNHFNLLVFKQFNIWFSFQFNIKEKESLQKCLSNQTHQKIRSFLKATQIRHDFTHWGNKQHELLTSAQHTLLIQILLHWQHPFFTACSEFIDLILRFQTEEDRGTMTWALGFITLFCCYDKARRPLAVVLPGTKSH